MLSNIANNLHMFYVPNANKGQKKNKSIAQYTATQIVNLVAQTNTTQGKLIIWTSDEGLKLLNRKPEFKELLNMDNSFVQRKDPTPYLENVEGVNLTTYNPANQKDIGMVKIMQEVDEEGKGGGLYIDADIVDFFLQKRTEKNITTKIDLSNLSQALNGSEDIICTSNPNCFVALPNSARLNTANDNIKNHFNQINSLKIFDPSIKNKLKVGKIMLETGETQKSELEKILNINIVDITQNPKEIIPLIFNYKKKLTDSMFLEVFELEFSQIKPTPEFKGLTREKALEKKAIWSISSNVLYPPRRHNGIPKYEDRYKYPLDIECSRMNQLGQNIFSLSGTDMTDIMNKPNPSSYL